MQQTKLVTVTNYEIQALGLIIELECNIEISETLRSVGEIMKIRKCDFETFLRVNDMLDWELNYCEAGEHVQRSGTMSMSEYWEQNMPYIYEDLEKYLVKNRIVDYSSILTPQS